MEWLIGSSGQIRGAKTITSLRPGVYSIEEDAAGPYLQYQNLITDNIVELADETVVRVLKGIQTFWKRRGRYEEYGLVYKRGVLLWGPPGSGKTVAVNLLMKELIGLNCVILLCGQPELLGHMLQRVRQMEPDRHTIVIMEDIDEIIDAHGEQPLLSILDGENQIENCVYITTTNYPERLGARIVNRPSRFDERIFVGMPSLVVRNTYLKFAAPELDKVTVDLWVNETNNFSVAHLRELVASVHCLNQPYDEVMKRLRSVTEKPKFVDGCRKGNTGFDPNTDDEDE